MNLSIQSSTQKPILGIFLDIDGVLNDTRKIKNYKERLISLTEEIFGADWGMRQYIIAKTHFFDENAVKNFHALIDKIKGVAEVRIIISSDWRLGRSVDDLKTEVFAKHMFAEFIYDKTIDNLQPVEGEIHCEGGCNCRSAEINHWLKQHPEMTDYVVFDDLRFHHIQNFQERFVEVDAQTLITAEQIEQVSNRLLSSINNHLKAEMAGTEAIIRDIEKLHL
ncbi:MAG: domain in Swiss Army Knife repair protein [Chlamydiales bacterium]|nr:domain in Swiss Army Knife repair protein [Chlamydiales bacterium]